MYLYTQPCTYSEHFEKLEIMTPYYDSNLKTTTTVFGIDACIVQHSMFKYILGTPNNL
jgi:hypothetical protein